MESGLGLGRFWGETEVKALIAEVSLNFSLCLNHASPCEIKGATLHLLAQVSGFIVHTHTGFLGALYLNALFIYEIKAEISLIISKQK